MKKTLCVLLVLSLVLVALPFGIVSFAAGDTAVEGRAIHIIRNGEALPTVYNTFSAAYNASVAGDIIDLPAGDYECAPADATVKQARAFAISKSVTIRGAADGVTRFFPVASWAPTADLQQKLFNIGGSNVVLENITIDSEGKNIYGLYSSCTGLTFKNTVIRNSGRSMLIVANGSTVCEGLYVYSPETEFNSSRSYAHIDLTGGTFTFNKGIIHAALKVDGGTIVNNSASLIKISILVLFTTYDFYMSPSLPAVIYGNLSYTLKTKIKDALKADASILSNTAAFYEGISNYEISGNDKFGLSYEDVMSMLVTMAGDAGSANTDSKNRLSAVVSKIASVKGNRDNSFSALTYTADTASPAGVTGFDAAQDEYSEILPYECSPAATLSLSGTLSSGYAQIMSLGNVTLIDGVGFAQASVWAYGASPQIRTYRVNFTVPKYTVSFVSGDNGEISGNTLYSAYYGTLLELPVCTPRAGYVFGGWSPAVPENITASAEYTASFERENTVELSAQTEETSFACGVICGDKACDIVLLLTPAGGSADIFSPTGESVSGAAVIATGMTVRLTHEDTSVAEFTIVIKGDVYGDGVIDENDFNSVLNASVGAASLSDAERLAADINGDGLVDALDAMFSELLGSGHISSEEFNAYSLS